MEVYILPVPGSREGFLIYRPLAGLAFVGNRPMADLAMRFAGDRPGPDLAAAGEAWGFLEEIGFFAPDPPAPGSLPDGLAHAVLLLTNRCQLRCTYCYAAAGESPRRELLEEHARVAIDTVAECALSQGLNQFEVSFHGGGEPTLAWQTLRSATVYARSKTLPAQISLTTNAVWSASQRDWILGAIDSLTISMDGAPGTQDTQRPFASGRKSSLSVMRNIAAIDRKGTRYGIRMTATPPWDDLATDVEFICSQTGSQTIQVEPAFNPRRGQHALPGEDQWLAFSRAFLQAYRVASSFGRSLRYSGARPGTTAAAFCTAPYNALVVAPGGAIVACYEISSADHPLSNFATFGKIEAGRVVLDEARRASFYHRLEERRESCRGCFCYWSCAGDCFTRAFLPGDGGHRAKTPRCDMNRAITLNLLLDLIAEGDGYWNARRPERQAGEPVALG